MEQLILRIRHKVEQLLHMKVDHIEKFDNVPNNSVYKIISENKSYIFKIYKQRDWPEDGKLEFINQTLINNQIPCAKLIAFDRTDQFFETGYLLEEYLPGVTADHIVFDAESGKEFYEKLAHLVSRIHRIPIENYGYIGSGIASSSSFLAFMTDKFDEIVSSLIDKKLFDKSRLMEIKQPLMEGLRTCESLPSILNHGDLSTKNVMIDSKGELTLIDWDDAMSYNWIADIARMTYWMKFYYNAEEYELYRNTFMEHYTIDSSIDTSIDDFNAIENIFHIWIGLDHLNYLAGSPEYEDRLVYSNETIARLSIQC